jgi:hypothetical protein
LRCLRGQRRGRCSGLRCCADWRARRYDFFAGATPADVFLAGANANKRNNIMVKPACTSGARCNW